MLHWTPREKKLAVLLGLSLAFLLSMSYVIWSTDSVKEDSMPFEAKLYEEPVAEGEVTAPLTELETIWVDVKGAVHRPGVYELASSSRVYQALEASGGMLAEAETRAVNLAKTLQDGEMVYIPLKGEEPLPMPSVSSGKAGSRVNINTATAEELDQLPGIGAVKAAAIVEYREKQGRFEREEDLKKVTGIGDKLFEKVKEQISVK
ncbi:helix-hairpin-helix domain-containing protein [Ammoniphilus sp. YIM 78166]|uniref:helix-hairpin-helix domain-containing protein n=1 Tax=Ammoniphilus sp. YIM 78166 TaxID=1644106 RepID=UPI00106FD453|nr:helix-hairpin-helix domain-containing protein [Ammoniphilus sp. YIM 78166]